LGLFVLGFFLFSALSLVSATPSVTLNNPLDDATFAEGSDVNFNCSFDSDGSEISKLEVLYKADYADSFSTLYTFNKGSFGEEAYGSNFSGNYLNEYHVFDNPTGIVSSDTTCDGTGDACNLFNTSGDNVVGGYWTEAGVGNSYFTINLNDTLSVSGFNLIQHATFFANDSKL